MYVTGHLLPGVVQFVQWLIDNKKKFLFLTNTSSKTQAELAKALTRYGIDVCMMYDVCLHLHSQVSPEHFYTSALATAAFISSQKPHATAFTMGEPGLINALYAEGITMASTHPDYVVVGDCRNYSFLDIQAAVNHIIGGARFVATNIDVLDKAEGGTVTPGCGSLATPIECATGIKPYYCGKPNPLMMRTAMRRLGCKRTETVIIGDRLDTDILGGVEADIDTVCHGGDDDDDVIGAVSDWCHHSYPR